VGKLCPRQCLPGTGNLQQKHSVNAPEMSGGENPPYARNLTVRILEALALPKRSSNLISKHLHTVTFLALASLAPAAWAQSNLVAKADTTSAKLATNSAATNANASAAPAAAAAATKVEVSPITCPAGEGIVAINSSGTATCAAAGVPIGSSVGTTLTYDTNHYAYIYSQGGGFSPVMFIVPDAATQTCPTCYHTIAVNVDNQTNYTTYNTALFPNTFSSALRLDQDGSLGLAAGAGGGIATDPSTGNTCIPPTVASISCNGATNSLHISNSGLVNSYLSAATTGNGIGIEVYSSVDTELSGSLGATTIFTTPATYNGSTTQRQEYHAHGYMEMTSAAPGATCSVVIGYTHLGNARSVVTPAAACGTLGSAVPYDLTFVADPGTAVNIAVSISSGSPTYLSSLKVLLL